jgi:HAD superfamily hydrolase (TIGR01509 family)
MNGAPTLSIPKLVIFDCDGVLVDSEPIAARVTVQMMIELGIPTTVEEVRTLFLGDTLANVVRGIEQRAPEPPPAGWVDTMEARLWDEFRRSLKPVSGAPEAVDRVLAAGIAACVASQGAPEKMQVSLGVTGLLPRFAGRVFSARMVARPKPFPDLFLYAAEQLGVAPEQTVVVEDSAFGVRAAVAAGMRALGYSASVGPRKLADAGAEVFDSMHDLPRLLGLAPE